MTDGAMNDRDEVKRLEEEIALTSGNRFEGWNLNAVKSETVSPANEESVFKVEFVNNAQMIWIALNNALSVIRKFHQKCEGNEWCKCSFCSQSDLMQAEFVAGSYTKEELASSSLSSQAIGAAAKDAAEKVVAALLPGLKTSIPYQHIKFVSTSAAIISAELEKARTK